MDDFEVYIQSNRDQFKEAPLNKDLLWQKIEQRLEHEAKPKVFTLNPLLKIAAIAILFVGLGFLTYQMNFNKISNNKYTSEIVEIKAHYNHLIHLKIAQIENAQPLTKNEKNTYLQLIDDLDKDANDLQTELQQNINNTVVIEAIVQNYKQRLQLLELLQNRLKKNKIKKDEQSILI